MPPKPRNRDRLSVYFLSAGLFLAGALLALLVTRGYAIDIDSLTLQKRGVIVLHSEPDSAEVTLDGKRLGKRTDARLSLAPDTYRLKVETPGRIPWEREVRLAPGEAVIEEIVLFPDAPGRTDLTERPVERYAVSPNGRRIAAVTSRRGDALLHLLDSEGQERYAARLDAAPGSVAVDDGEFALAESAGRIAVYDPTGKRVGNIPGGKAAFVGGRVVFQRGPRLLSTDRNGAEGQVLATSPRGWAATAGNVYILGRDGALADVTPGTAREAVPDVAPVRTIASAGPEAVQVTQTGGSFGIIRNGSYVPIGQGAARVFLSPDGKFVAYRTSREIRLFDLETGRDRLVTSLTDPPERITPLPGGYYLLFRRSDGLHAIARDGSNDRVVARLVGGEPTVLGLDRILTTDTRTGRLVRIDLKD
ncbi:MAG TPA: PEGA domain-containing protein [Patescibacteria group bacterium]|jgi:hypothetical protein